MPATPSLILPVTMRQMNFASFGVASLSRSASNFIFVSCEPEPSALAIFSRFEYTRATDRLSLNSVCCLFVWKMI